MYFKKWMAATAVAALLAGPFMALQAQSHDQPAYKAVFWETALQKANKAVDNRGTVTVLGTAVGEQVRRISRHAQENNRLKNFYASLGKNKKKLFQCKANYHALKTAANANPLFNGYGLTAVDLNSFCTLSLDQLYFLKRFFNGQVKPVQVRQYKEDVLAVLLNDGNEVFWLVVNPPYKMLTFHYKDPSKLKEVEELSSKYVILSLN